MVKRSLKTIREAFSRADLSHRGSDEEYAHVVETEAKAFEPYRKRAEATMDDLDRYIQERTARSPVFQAAWEATRTEYQEIVRQIEAQSRDCPCVVPATDGHRPHA